MPTYTVLGNSHLHALERAWTENRVARPGVRFVWLNIGREYPAARALDILSGGPLAEPARAAFVALTDRVRELSSESDATVFSIQGNEHNIVGLFERVSQKNALERIRWRIPSELGYYLDRLLPVATSRVVLLLPPPPIESAEHIAAHPGTFAKFVDQLPIRAAADRLELWQLQAELTAQVAQARGVPVLPPPPGALSDSGFLARGAHANDPTHAGPRYGKLQLEAVLDHLERPAPVELVRVPREPHPYSDLPDRAFWKQSISTVAASDVDPVTNPPFQIAPRDLVATAGSCFAMHISKRLRSGGFRFFLAEKPTGPADGVEARGYYDFSARYGNIYTARQLLQLFQRAFGYFAPLERSWQRVGGGLCDPFRPRIEPRGFASQEELLADLRAHKAAVRRMFLKLNVLVFTLGLTEAWRSRRDGAIYPVAPGVVGGTYDPTLYEFVNFSVSDVVSDLREFIAKLRVVNPKARLILTVSPVPLVATAEDRHVLVSTTYSKSVLRVASEEIVRSHEGVCYFPSYEIITGSHAPHEYFAPDRRSVTEAGIDHVMRIFMTRMTRGKPMPPQAPRPEDASNQLLRELEAAAQQACDEEALAR